MSCSTSKGKRRVIVSSDDDSESDIAAAGESDYVISPAVSRDNATVSDVARTGARLCQPSTVPEADREQNANGRLFTKDLRKVVKESGFLDVPVQFADPSIFRVIRPPSSV
ncbi:hypothetical protein DPMN_094018 [Dreissena polymorpha]|uniref:Uncharacterized protein n=1 Tax=Dreissena polymorpha TaxID=45954 RepID=A0A9D4R1F9_DREPO|nr:hypothetical protein DPMN_094018 [Dreissena polymorpha]